jgi:myosin heavy subunit
MVVAINPFKLVEKYGEHCIPEYRNKPATELPAHLYSIAQQAYSYVRSLFYI